LKRGALPVDEAIVIAKQIAEALEEAHEKGIVHRDLKPANVKLAPDGKVKVFDFGLAKAWTGDGASGTSSADVSHSPTMTRGTEAGMILGTAAYMSPEQARGKAVDKRADIWAFGVVVFEMLTGRRLFDGETATDVLAAVVRQDIPWDALPAATPASLRGLLRRCLGRDARSRLRDIGEARIALGDAPALAAAPATTLAPQAAAPWKSPAAWAALVLVAAVGGWGWTHLRPSVPLTVTRFTIPLPAGQVLGGNSGPAITRDGHMIAYVAQDASGVPRLYLRALDRFESSLVPESESA
jgi:serine/threonine-protein kinase